jgi:hypothetical protein
MDLHGSLHDVVVLARDIGQQLQKMEEPDDESGSSQEPLHHM